MRNLLSSAFFRLKKNSLFYFAIFTMIAIGIVMLLLGYADSVKYEYKMYPDLQFFTVGIYINIAAAIFTCLFISTEYNDGTIRNKIIVGHRRISIYMVNFIVAFFANIILLFAYLLPMTGISLLLNCSFETDTSTILLSTLGLIILTGALSALFTFISMTIQSRTYASVIAIVTTFLLLFVGIYLVSCLSQPETYIDYGNVYISSDAQSPSESPQEPEEVPNPGYISGTKRIIYENILELIPPGQGLLYAQIDTSHLWNMYVYSGVILVVFSAVGYACFRKKDIK